MSSSITSSSADPKRPNAVVPYHSPIKDIDEIDRDVYGVTSLLLSTIGLVLKIKFASWTALMFAIVSVTNEKLSDQDPNSGRTSGFTGLLFATSGIFANYMYLFVNTPNSPLAPTTTTAAAAAVTD